MKKLFCILFALILIILPLSSCGSEENADNNIDATTAGQTTAEGESIKEKVAPMLPDMDLNHKEFMFYVMGIDRNVNNYSEEIYAEAETGEPINDSVYKRNIALEEKYNFKILETPEKEGDLSVKAKKLINAGDDQFQVFMMNLAQSANLARQGMLTDIRTMEYIDLSKPWWDQRSNDDFSMMNKTFYAVGDINIMDNNATWAVFFNKKLVSELGLDMPYKYVNENNWTLDKFYEYQTLASKDINGDGVMNYDDDRWGLAGDNLNTYMFYVGAGEKITSKNQKGEPYLDMFTERGTDVFEKVIKIQTDVNSSILADKATGYANVYSDLLRRNFKQDKALFYVAGLLSFTLLRDMESEYGMVPLPKYDSVQSEYHTTFNPNNASCLSVPITNKTLNETGFVIEAMAAESMDTLTPAYFEVALTRKYMRDTESDEMLKIILSSRSFDLAVVNDWGGSFSLFGNMTTQKSTDFASEYEKIKLKAETAIQKSIETFLTVE